MCQKTVINHASMQYALVELSDMFVTAIYHFYYKLMVIVIADDVRISLRDMFVDGKALL